MKYIFNIEQSKYDKFQKQIILFLLQQNSTVCFT